MNKYAMTPQGQYHGPLPVRDFFPLPNVIFDLGLTAEEIAWLKNAKARGTWLAVALVADGDAAKFERRREALEALRCVDRVLPVTDWADLKDAVKNLRILLVAKETGADSAALGGRLRENYV